MAQIILNVKDSDIGKFNDKDMLAYDEEKKQFYLVTAKSFFEEYDKMLKDLLKRYDEKVEILLKENKDLREDNVRMKEKLQTFANDLIEKTREINKKSIEMIEKFIKSGGK